MKALVTTMFLVCFAFLGSAQNGNVNIEQDQKIAELLEIYKTANSSSGFYTIQVGFGSLNEAKNLKAKTDVDFPYWYSKIIFDSPTYRLHVGRFKTKLEAERKFMEVRKKYPAALLLKPKKK